MKYWPPILLMLAALALTACGQTDALNANAAQSIANLPVEQTATATATPTPPTTATPTDTATSTPAPSPTVTATPTITPSPTATPGPAIRRLTEGDCCTQPFWSADSTEVRFIDLAPETGQPAIMGIDIARPEAGARVVSARLGIFSPDGRLLAYPQPGRTGLAVLEDLSTGESWTVDIDESAVRFSPDGQQLFWTAFDADQPFENRVSTFWLADLRGENRRQVAALRRGSTLAWLNDTAMLVAYLHPAADDTAATPQRYAIARLNLTDGSLTDLFYTRRPRGLALNPARTDMVFYSLLNDNPADNGVWHVRLDEANPVPRRLPFLGSYQWRDDDTLVYIPFDPQAERHVFYSYNVRTGESQSLTGQTEPALTVANNDWAISPDGRHIVLAAGKNRRADGLWLVTLSP